jgi:hypothetical protein
MKEGDVSKAAQNNRRKPPAYFVAATALALLDLPKTAPAQTQVSLKTPIALSNGGKFDRADLPARAGGRRTLPPRSKQRLHRTFRALMNSGYLRNFKYRQLSVEIDARKIYLQRGFLQVGI